MARISTASVMTGASSGSMMRKKMRTGEAPEHDGGAHLVARQIHEPGEHQQEHQRRPLPDLGQHDRRHRPVQIRSQEYSNGRPSSSEMTWLIGPRSLNSMKKALAASTGTIIIGRMMTLTATLRHGHSSRNSSASDERDAELGGDADRDDDDGADQRGGEAVVEPQVVEVPEPDQLGLGTSGTPLVGCQSVRLSQMAIRVGTSTTAIIVSCAGSTSADVEGNGEAAGHRRILRDGR